MNQYSTFRVKCVMALFSLMGAATMSPPTRAADAPITAEEATTVALQIDQSMKHGDPTVYNQLLDKDALVATSAAGLGIDPKLLVAVKSGLNLPQGLARNVQLGGSYRFLHLTNTDGVVHPLFRLLPSGGGVNYHEMTLGRSANGTVRVVDIYVFTQGELLSQTIHRPLVSVAASLNRNLVEKFMGLDNDYVEHSGEVQTFMTESTHGQWKLALTTYDSLPQSLQHEKTNMVLRLNDAAEVDHNLYQTAFKEFESMYPGDPSLLLLELDRWTLAKQYDQEQVAIDQLDQRVGGDPYLEFLRGSNKVLQGRRDEAKALFTHSTQLDPSLKNPWEALIELSLAAHDNAETARLLDASTAGAGIRWTKVSSAGSFQDFVKSPEGAAWVQAHSQHSATGVDSGI